MGERRLLWAGAAVLAAAGLAARLWHVFADPLWLDEAYSAFAAGHDLRFLWRVVPLYETHPPFYYTLLHLWEAPFGDSLAALRAFGLVPALLTPPAVAWTAATVGRMLGWEATRRERLLFAAFAFACLALAFVEMAREVRPYPLMILLYALETRALLAIAVRRTAGGPLAGRAYAAHLLILALMLWLHNLGPLWAAAMVAALAVAIAGRRLTRADAGWLVGGHLLVGLVWLPGVLILADQAPTWIRSTWVTFSFAGLWDRLAALYAVPGWQALAAMPLAGLALATLWRPRAGRKLAAMLLILAVAPTLLSIVLSLTVAPVFVTRTLSPVTVPTVLLLAIGAAGWRGRAGWVGFASAAFLVANMTTVALDARRAGPPQDWYGTVAWLAKRWRPGDLILAYPNEGALPLARALRDQGLAWPVRPIPAPPPALGWGDWHPTGNRGVPTLPRPVLARIARDPAIRAAPTVWLLRLGAATYDPGDMFLAELRPGRHVVRRWLAGPIDIIGLRRN